MCGIAGCVGGTGDHHEIVHEQLARLAHRGPDAQGRFARDGAIIAQNRLSIIDLDHGDPPITNEDGTIGVVQNGEIYNFAELRRQLIARGHRFGSAGDTEVIAHLAEELEPVALMQALDGMFAVAVWDARRKRLILGRDRSGKKPLYYAMAGDVLVFASEIKGVLAHPDVPRTLNPRAIPAYLTFGYVPTPETFFHEVYSAPPGHVLVLEPGGGPVLHRYWSPPLPGRDGAVHADLDARGAARAVRAGLESAVQRRLVADVTVGAFLSGGIDSSAIVGLMARMSDQRVPTFTIGFDDRDGFDEREHARVVARAFGTDHHEEVARPAAVDLVERLVHHHDQPFGDSSAVPTFLLAEMTGRDVKVALSGDGGDELFAGYERFAAARAVSTYAALPTPARRGARAAIDALPAGSAGGRGGRLQRFAGSAERGLPVAYRAWLSIAQDPLRRALLGPSDDPWAVQEFDARWEATRGAATLDRLLRLNFDTYLVDDLLVKADRMSMAHGLEVRSPFLDTALVELSLSLAPRLKVRGVSLKRVLRAAVADLLPDSILERRKRGFGVPMDRWFREDLAGYVGSTLGAGDASVRRHLQNGPLDALLTDHAAGRAQHGHVLWTLLTLEVFLRREGW